MSLQQQEDAFTACSDFLGLAIAEQRLIGRQVVHSPHCLLYGMPEARALYPDRGGGGWLQAWSACRS